MRSVAGNVMHSCVNKDTCHELGTSSQQQGQTEDVVPSYAKNVGLYTKIYFTHKWFLFQFLQTVTTNLMTAMIQLMAWVGLGGSTVVCDDLSRSKSESCEANRKVSLIGGV